IGPPGGSFSNVVITTPIDENQTVTMTGTISNSGTDTLTMIIDWFDGTSPETFVLPFSVTSFALTHLYLDNVPSGLSSNIPVQLSLTDLHNHTNTAVVRTVVNDLPPTLVNAGLTSGAISQGDIETLTGSITDPGPLDTFTFVVNWGDGQLQ